MAEPRTLARGDRVTLDPTNGPFCYVCGWGEGEGFVVEGQWSDEMRRYRLEVICWVCYNTSSGNTVRWGVRRVGHQATSLELHRAMAEHTNLILKEIRRGRTGSE